MKHLPKHLRPRWRYLAIAIEGWPDASVGRRDFQRSLWFAAQNLLGDVGSADADLTVLRFSVENGTGESIVRVRRGEVERARAAMACIHEIDGQAVGLKVLGVSGTVRACSEKYLGGRREFFGERKVVFEDAERTAFQRDGLLDVQMDGAFAGTTELDVE